MKDAPIMPKRQGLNNTFLLGRKAAHTEMEMKNPHF